jgi:hypothetical protein
VLLLRLEMVNKARTYTCIFITAVDGVQGNQCVKQVRGERDCEQAPVIVNEWMHIGHGV